jgi:hypothetical protein
MENSNNKCLELSELSSLELVEIDGGNWAYDLGYWVGDAWDSFTEGFVDGYNNNKN